MKPRYIPGILLLLILTCLTGGKRSTLSKPFSPPHTFCNPVDISYRFALDEPSRREAADPTVTWFRDRYYLFASKSGGYWHSKDLTNWSFIETDQIPTEEYAPTTVALNDTLYFLASSGEKSTIYKSEDPLSGTWRIALDSLEIPVWDPAFFLDDDQRLYLYWGCSNVNPLYGVELDYRNGFAFIGKPRPLKWADPEHLGWEVPGDYNILIHQAPWIEGSWMNKHDGKYYLQYAGPGTEYKSYSDAVYVSDHPLGPFHLQDHNPFAYRPEGFAAGAGHGSTFTDRYGNYWHIGTVTISQKHIFERRLALYPAFFDKKGSLYCITKYGDYPLIMPSGKIRDFSEIFPGWMLLSYGKPVEVSSSIDSLPPSNMTDEDIRTYWSAASGKPGEYAILDLGGSCDVYALQVNFAEHNTALFGRNRNAIHRYTIEASDDKISWKMLADNSKAENDNTHHYIPLPEKISSRYIKITNLKVPGGNFALSGFRIFGKGSGETPGIVTHFEVKRDPDDKRCVSLSWNSSQRATGYTISYGLEKDRLYQHYMVYGDTTLTLRSLNTGLAYCFSIEAFNENGITPSGLVILIE